MHLRGIIAGVAASLIGATAVCAADQTLPQVDAIYMADDAVALGWYASAKIGVALPGTINMTATAAGFPDLTGDARFKAGVAGAVAVGKYLAPNFRAEAELAVANNAGDSFTGAFAGFPGQTTGSLTGNVTTVSVMAMGYYEFSQFGDFVPYLSAGLGAANVISDLTYNDPGALGFPINGTITGTSTVFAGRVGAGFQYALSDSLDLTADYTLLVGSRANLAFTGAGGLGNRNVSASVLGHAFALGLKARF
jgi:opacity protein-like surface antigen